MTGTMRKSLGLLAAVLLLAVVGCCQKEKDELKQLAHMCNKLSEDRETLQLQLDQANSDNEAVQQELATKDTEVVELRVTVGQLQAEVDDLKDRPPEGPKAPAGWDRTASGAKITVGSDVLFGSGRATLSAKGKAALNKVLSDLKATYAGMPVRVYGHTDSDPIRRSKWKDNLELSSQRAMAVSRYLISRGIKAKRIETIGMGAVRPVASNDTAPGKRQNRRVDIVVIQTP